MRKEKKDLGADAAEVATAGSIDRAVASHDAPKHTPGPWYVERKYDGGCTVAIMRDWTTTGVALAVHGPERWIHSVDDETIEANAHLIAAAPDLLGACKKAEQMIHSEYCGASHNPFCEELERLIAKAEGR